MTTIFISHAPEDAACAEQIRTDLESQGYHTWREPKNLTLDSILYPTAVEQVILSSAAVVLLWSSAAAQSEWVEHQLLFAHQLRKVLAVVVLNGAALPATLVAVSTLTRQSSCTDLVAQLMPLLPAAMKTDALTTLSERAANPYIRERRAAIEQAAEMLQRGEQREEVLAILEYLKKNDLMTGVREKVQEVLEDDARKTGAAPPMHQGDSRHIFGVRCKNGHVSYFDKRLVCKATTQVPRDLVQRAGKELDELHLTCDTCGEEVIARVDCEGYK